MEYRRPFFLVWIISNARIAVVVVVGGGIKLCSVRFPVLAPTPPKTSCLQTWCNIVCYKHQLSINGRNKLIYHCHNLTGQSVYTVWLCPVEVNYQLPWFHCNFFKVCSNQVLMSKIVSSWELWHKIVLVSFGKIIYSGIISKILNTYYHWCPLVICLSQDNSKYEDGNNKWLCIKTIAYKHINKP